MPVQTPRHDEDTLLMPRAKWSELQCQAGGGRFSYKQFMAIAEHAIKASANQSGLSVETVIPVIEKSGFKELCNMASASQAKGVYCPLLTWHGSESLETISSIAKHGYLHVGDPNPESGEEHIMQRGNVLGTGIYSSCLASVASWYSHEDHRREQLVLVNLTIVGKLRMLYSKTDFRRTFINQQSESSELIEKSYKDSSGTGAGQPERLMEAEASDPLAMLEVNTMATPNLDIIVSSNKEWVVPLFKVHLKHKSPQPLLSAAELRWRPTGPDVMFRQVATELFTLDLASAVGCGGNGSHGQQSTTTAAHAVYAFTDMVKSNQQLAQTMSNFLGGCLDNSGGSKTLFLCSSDPKTVITATVVTGYEQVNTKIASTATSGFDTGKLVSLDWCGVVRNAAEWICSEPDSRVGLDYRIVYFIVPRSDTVNTAGVAAVVDELEYYVRAHNVVIKLILEDTDDTQVYTDVCAVKSRFQTVSAWEEFLYPTASTTTYPEIFTALATESANLKINGTTHIGIPYPYGTIGTGFLTDLEDHGQWKVSVREGQKDLVYRGKPVPFVTIGGQLCRASVCTNGSADGAGRRRKQPSTSVAQPDADTSVIASADAVIGLLLAYRTRVHGNIERHSRHSIAVVQLCDMVTDTLARTLSSVQKALSHASASATGTDQYLLSARRHVRSRYLRILKLSAEISVFANLQMDSKWAAKLNDMKFFRSVARRSKASQLDPAALLKAVQIELRAENIDAGVVHSMTDAAEALELTRVVGYGLRVLRTSASEVEPWQVLPTYVDALPRHRVSDVYNREELGLVDIEDDNGADATRTPSMQSTSSPASIINAVLPLDWVVPSPGTTTLGGGLDRTGGADGDGALYKMIGAYTCTGNPYLWIPSQPLAILCCSLWSLVESIFKICTKKDVDSDRVHAMVQTALDLARATKTAVASCGWAHSLVKKLQEHAPDGVGIAAAFTESSGILSLCMALSALLLSSAKPLFTSDAPGATDQRLSHLSLLLVAESVARICRVQLRSSGRTANEYICGALGMKGNKSGTPLVHQHRDVDMKASTLYTSKFFRNRKVINCNAYAVVAGLEFIARFHAGSDVHGPTTGTTSNDPVAVAAPDIGAPDCTQRIAEDFSQRRVSMKAWIQRHKGTSTATGRDFQLAFFLDGLKYNSSAARQEMRPMTDPTAVIQQHIDEQQARIAARVAKRKLMAETRKKRLQQRIQKGSVLAQYHTTPTVFTRAAVDHLNTLRPSWDQVELTPSGLLRHHCCYPLCPCYLMSFRTDEDRVHGTRRGIFAHLDLDLTVNNNFTPKFHALVKHELEQSPKITEEKLVEKVHHYLQLKAKHGSTVSVVGHKIPAGDGKTGDVAADSAVELEIRQVYRQWQSVAAAADGTIGVVDVDVCTMLRRADELLCADTIDDFISGINSVCSRSDAMFRQVERGLLHADHVFPKAIEKLWLCAFGRRGPEKQCKIDWIASERVRPPVVVKYIARLESGLGNAREAEKMREFVHKQCMQQERFWSYRPSNAPNRQGHSNANPSYFAFGFETLAQMQQCIPYNVYQSFVATRTTELHPSPS
eukprot:m.1607511 g.1607511  ORF g.1607511 m.1607511 type:complete len:1564 (-) comp25362_c0_seq6:2375-7066(-)